ncbi:hypothetical protein [Spiroplasma endosymbiont of Dasysyrphus albostriatus]|uniref:hypothetical protein n=1 Tax=Spiroplasma endosymbiont of Dasysyrphus albostriatus TaxID=3066299 RepID=UPI0030D1F8F9
MKYFNPSYWFKLWVLSAPLFNDKTKGINAKSIDNNQKIKDWVNKNTTNLESINQEISFTNSTTNYQPYNLSQTSQNIDPFYQTYLYSLGSQELEIRTHKHYHEKSRNRHKRQPIPKKDNYYIPINELRISSDFSEYENSFQQIIDELIEKNILIIVLADPNRQQNHQQILILNRNSDYGYIRLRVNLVITRMISSSIELILRTDNLYLEGFTFQDSSTRTYNYYYFNFDNINQSRQPLNVRQGLVPHFTQMIGFDNIRLNNIGPDYRYS